MLTRYPCPEYGDPMVHCNQIPPATLACLDDPAWSVALEPIADMIANGWLGNRGAMTAALDKAYARHRFATDKAGETHTDEANQPR